MLRKSFDNTWARGDPGQCAVSPRGGVEQIKNRAAYAAGVFLPTRRVDTTTALRPRKTILGTRAPTTTVMTDNNNNYWLLYAVVQTLVCRLGAGPSA